MKATKTKSINLRVSPLQKKRIDKLAAYHEVSVTHLILMLIRRAEVEMENRS